METPAARGDVFNIGNAEEVTILHLAEKIRTLTGSKSPIRLVPYSQAFAAGFEDMARRVPDLSKVRRMIDYRPTRDLDQILLDVLEPMTGVRDH